MVSPRSGFYKSLGYSDAEFPCKVRKTTKNEKVEPITPDEVIELKSGIKTTQTTCSNLAKDPNLQFFPVSEIAVPRSTFVQKQVVQTSTYFNDEKFSPGFSSNQYLPARLTCTPGVNDGSGKAVDAEPSSCKSLPHELSSVCSFSLIKCYTDDADTDNPGDGKSNQGAALGLSKEKKFGSVPLKEVIPGDDPAVPKVPAKVVKDSSYRIKHQTYNSASLLPTKPPLSVIQQKDPQVIEPNHKYPPNGPALEVLWKGSFEVLDVDKVHDTPHNVNHCEGFRAHPAAKVSRKVFEFAKQITGVIQFKLHPRCSIWPDTFQTYMPDQNDIALYFYPGNFEWSRKKYSILLKYIEKNDLALSSRMGSVELLIFASKLLPGDSQKLKGSFFMWGVLHRLKGSKLLESPSLPSGYGATFSITPNAET